MRKKGAILIAVLVVLVGYIGYPYFNLYKAKNLDILSFDGESISLEIENDVPFTELANYLYQKNVINDTNSFNLLIDYKNYSQTVLKKSKITIQRKWSNNVLVNQLYLMRNQKIISLTVPSVRTLEDLANHISKFISVDFTQLYASFTDPAISAKYGFTTVQFPCMFIPNTYEVYANFNSNQFISFMAKEYKKFWNSERKKKALKIGLSQSEITILASIVQSEQSLKYDEHSTIAGLYLNRLNKNMKLQADPTVKFALNKPELRRLYYRHLEVDSPYNTYKYAGLPPGPICIVDPRVIDAVLNYEKHNYLFMCAQPAYSGYHNFSSTNAQHEKFKKEYTDWLKNENIH